MDKRRGFTLIEVLLVTMILAVVLCGLLAIYANLFFLTDFLRDYTSATNAVQAKMEELRKDTFDSLTVGSSTFNLTDYGFPFSDSKGVVEINSTSYADLKRIRIVACFKSRNKIIGEDQNLNGILNQGEDTWIVNNRLDSPVELVTLVAK